MRTKLIAAFLLLCFAVQAQSPSKILKPHFKKIQKQKPSRLSKDQANSLLKDADVFQVMGVYTRSSNEAVQREAVRLTTKLGVEHEVERSRKVAVHLLLEAAKSGSSVIQYQVAHGLQKFQVSDFDELARKLLVEHMQTKPNHIDEFFLTAGFLGMRNELEAMRPEYRKRSATRRALNLALTRCGNEQKIESMMENIEKIPVNDQFVYEVVPMMVYTRQRPQMDFLLNLIMSNKRSCRPVGEDAPVLLRLGHQERPVPRGR